MFCAVYIAANFLADIGMPLADPRRRYAQ
jgi:ABC-type dipeptide/oligopeptide/nickel transport system permease component